MVDDLIMLDQKKRALAARINYLLDRPPNLPVGRPVDFDFSRVAVSIEAIQQQALANNPALKAMHQEIAARGKNVELAKQEVRPDFNLKLAYGERQDRRDMLSGMIEMNLPIFIASKQERKVAQTHAELRAARAGYENSQNEILYMTADMNSMVQRLEQKIALYRTGIIPQARMQIDTAMSAYMVNKADFTTLLDSRMRLYRYELDYHDALTEYEKSVAALEALTGSKLPREVPQ